MNSQNRQGYTLVHTEWLTPFQSENTEYRIRAGALLVRSGERMSIYIPDAPQHSDEQTRQEIIDLAAKRCGISGDFIRQLATVLAAEGYRKFEIVEEDV
ncbi:hypothetical protein D3C71_1777610 [compost metagenome]